MRILVLDSRIVSNFRGTCRTDCFRYLLLIVLLVRVLIRRSFGLVLVISGIISPGNTDTLPTRLTGAVSPCRGGISKYTRRTPFVFRRQVRHERLLPQALGTGFRLDVGKFVLLTFMHLFSHTYTHTHTIHGRGCVCTKSLLISCLQKHLRMYHFSIRMIDSLTFHLL